jgi:hypothetical protein
MRKEAQSGQMKRFNDNSKGKFPMLYARSQDITFLIRSSNTCPLLRNSNFALKPF